MKTVKRTHFASLFGIAIILAIVLTVFTACPPDAEDETFTVSFDSDGGTSVATETVVKGKTSVNIKTDPVKDEALYSEALASLPATEGLYKKGKITYTFAGWFDASGTQWDSTMPITSDLSLKAKWDKTSGWDEVTIPTTVTGTIVEKTFKYLNDKDAAGKSKVAGAYTLFLKSNVNSGANTLDASEVDLTIIGLDSERKITLSGTAPIKGTLFTVGKAANSGSTADLAAADSSSIKLTLGDKVTLVGSDANDSALVQVKNKAVFTMETGSKVTGNKSSADSSGTGSSKGQGAAVYIGVSRVTVDLGGVAGEGGTFNLRGGEISGNGATASSNDYRVVGGLYADSSAVINLESGKIKDNTINSTASPTKNVYVTNSVILTVKGGVDIPDITLNSRGTLPSEGTTVLAGSIIISGAFKTADPAITLHLRGEEVLTSAIDTTGFSYWKDRVLLKAATGYTIVADDVAKFTLGKLLPGYAGGTPPDITSVGKYDAITTNAVKLIAK